MLTHPVTRASIDPQPGSGLFLAPIEIRMPFMSTSSPTESMYSFDRAKFTCQCVLNLAQPATMTALTVRPPALAVRPSTIGSQILCGRAACGPRGVLTGNVKR